MCYKPARMWHSHIDSTDYGSEYITWWFILQSKKAVIQNATLNHSTISFTSNVWVMYHWVYGLMTPQHKNISRDHFLLQSDVIYKTMENDVTRQWLGCYDGAVVKALYWKPPGRGFESSSCRCLWVIFPWVVDTLLCVSRAEAKWLESVQLTWTRQ